MMYLEIRKREKKVIRLKFRNINLILHYLACQSIVKDVRITDLPIKNKNKYLFVNI